MRGRRLFQQNTEAEADIRPTLLGVVTLLFLLLFFLLGTTSGQKLSVIGLKAGTAEGLKPLPHSGVLKSVRVEMHTGAEVAVYADLQTTDISASATTTEAREFRLPPVNGNIDRVGLNSALETLHGLDPSQRRASVLPSDAVTTTELLGVLDLVRGVSDSRFPEVVLTDLPIASVP
jgi:hypothetical protein